MARKAQSSDASHQEQLQKLLDENQALRDQLDRSRRLATVGTMAAIVAHEFNNILTPIVNYAELAQGNPSFADKAIGRAVDGGKRAAVLCNAILHMSSDAPSEVDDLDARQVLDETLALLGRDLGRDRIDFRHDVPEGLSLRSKRIELEQVLLNLILNARAAVLPKSGARYIRLDARRLDGHVEFRVSDNGVGIEAENLTRIFEPFFTTRREAEQAPGTGLGLTFCRETIEALGGSISVESQPGEGTTFTVRLPA